MMCFLFIGDFMYEKLSKKITKSLIQHNFVSENDAEIYIYSFQIILSTLVSSIFILIWAFLFKQVLNTIIFFIGFFLCRKFSGGYHANSQIACFIFTQLIFISFLTLITFSNIIGNNGILILVTLLSNIIIFFLAPVDNENKPFDDNEKLKFKRQSRVFAFVNIIVVLLLLCFSLFIDKLFCYILGVLAISIMLILGKIKNIASSKSKI